MDGVEIYRLAAKEPKGRSHESPPSYLKASDSDVLSGRVFVDIYIFYIFIAIYLFLRMTE